MVQPWKFIDKNGSFELPNPHLSSYLNFPLVNEAGMMSIVTPMLNGDIKTGQHTFLTVPVSVEDLHNTRSARNFWVQIAEIGAWSATGNSAAQIAKNFTKQEEEKVKLTAGFLWHQVTRENKRIGLRSVISSFVPSSNDQIELMSVHIENISDHKIQITPTAAIPIFGRSADNLREHRHVSSLLHQITCKKHGIVVRPTLSFDERGHQPNQTNYVVFGVGADGAAPQGFYPLVEDFIGEGGSLEWPEAVIQPQQNWAAEGQTFEGYEALGGLRFQQKDLQPGQSCTYFLMLGILPDEQDPEKLLKSYCKPEKFKYWMDKTTAFWEEKLKNLEFQSNDSQFDLWLKWVSIQPTLRRLFGNSFLPYHDYGRGGRGWRDLWQDILALLIMETGQVDSLLFDNFAGIRIDGSNATIIGSQSGEFKADRNNIPRVWMDHGAWPLLTTQVYINQTGDLEFLLRDQVYFKDHLTQRAQAIDENWEPSQGTQQQTEKGIIYQGTILEHLLIQHLTVFFNVGKHNHIKLEGADWNDGLDMAPQRGESVAFSAFYVNNLRTLSKFVQKLKVLGKNHVDLAEEILPLLDTVERKIDYEMIDAKHQRLNEYFAHVSHTISGRKIQISLDDVAEDLSAKAEWMANHIRKMEWITNQEGQSWFNGYYDNDGQRLEGDHPNGVRMTLTGQVFTLMGGIATDEQAQKIVQAVDHYLFDSNVGGYRLNTNFNEVLLNMGRCFGFAYGHKENGAMFTHMAVMYAYALYERGYVQQAYKTLKNIYLQSANFETSRMYPGLPEYFTPRGRGVYPYLTGSASWYLFTMLTQAFGIRGQLGDLVLTPKLVLNQFDAEGKASVRTRFADREIEITYQNPEMLDYGKYGIMRVSLNKQELGVIDCLKEYMIPRQHISDLEPNRTHQLTVWLAGSK